MELTTADFETLKALEEGLWTTEIRFSPAKMNSILSHDFGEFGRSGRRYSRADCLAVAPETISATLPLIDFEVKLISEDVALVTYKSIVQYAQVEQGWRSSVWSRTTDGWELRFHQGTPVYAA